MKRLTLLALIAVMMGGCAWLSQAKVDYQLGKTTPLATGEMTSSEQAHNFIDPLTALPYGQVAKVALIPLTLLFTYLRGRRIRKGQPVSSTPATGFVGAKIGLEWVVQAIANISHGAFEWGADGSPLKRGIKVGIAVILAGVAAAASSPDVAAAVASHPQLVAILTLLSGVVAALEKTLSQVLPVQQPPTP